jgi:hypothetical protein
VLLLLLGSWLIADLASTVAHAAVLLAPPLPDTLFLDLLDRIFPESSSFDAPTASTAAAARTAAAAATAFLQLVTSTLGLAATVPAESADKVFGSSEVAVSQAGLTSSSGGGGGGTPGAVVTSALWPWLQTIGTSGWLLLQRGRALINMLLESCCASTPRAALAITILAALLFALLLAPLPLSNDDDSDVEAGSGLEAYVVSQVFLFFSLCHFGSPIYYLIPLCLFATGAAVVGGSVQRRLRHRVGFHGFRPFKRGQRKRNHHEKPRQPDLPVACCFNASTPRASASPRPHSQSVSLPPVSLIFKKMNAQKIQLLTCIARYCIILANMFLFNLCF